ncbi:MAG: glycosyltransferase family 39 protein [Phycisphaerae bacterium]|nr:glycosyltransferase family 39 protein [Phycisphaerae bacterium]
MKAENRGKPTAPHFGSPRACLTLLFLLLLILGGTNLAYFWINCPIDLSGDEAQYWDWSRKLDWSFYSKPPGVAIIIRAATAVLGESMPAIRTPATLFFLAIVLGVYVLSWVLLHSHRVGLLAAVLCSLSPIMIYLSGAMTIDVPMIALWTWASVCAAVVVSASEPVGDRGHGAFWGWWMLVGVLVGLGFLMKYSAMIWFLGLLLLLLWQRAPLRQWLGGLVALGVACLFTVPVIWWNVLHDWVGLRHVARQTGAEGGQFHPGNVLEMIGGQFAAVSPPIALVMIAAVAWGLRASRRTTPHARSDNDHAAPIRFLLALAAPFWLLTFLVSFAAKVQVNWPAPAYVTLLVLSAAFLVRQAETTESWPRWRPIAWAILIFGLGAHVFMRDSSLLLPALKRFGLGDRTVAPVDVLSRLRGLEELGQIVDRLRRQLGDDSLILCDSYQQTALMAFYVPGRPRTFHAGLYFARPQRMNQYALWPEMQLDQPHLVGRNAVYVGKGGPLPEPLPRAFERVERLPDVPVMVRGVQVTTFKLWKCYGFRGLQRPSGGGF